MRTAASAFPNSIAAELEGLGPRSVTLLRRARQRRHTLAIQVVSYALGAAVLLVYAYAGTISPIIPAAFFLCGTTLIGIFAVLSETHFNDRFQDHFLTVYQVSTHVVIQLGFLLAAPEIGYAFLNVLFLIFAVASLRMTSFQALIGWTITALGVAPIFILTRIPIGMPVETLTERLRGSPLLHHDDRTMRLRRTLRRVAAQEAVQEQRSSSRKPTGASKNSPNSTN